MAVDMNIKNGRGRPKQPLEKRKVLSDKPHKNRVGEPDLPMGITLGLEAIPANPPIHLNKYEQECWDMIAETQRGLNHGSWIYRSDCAYVLATCVLYGRWREVREELTLYHEEFGSYLLEDKAHPLIGLEANLISKYHTSLSALGMNPTRRQVSISSDSDSNPEDDLLS